MPSRIASNFCPTSVLKIQVEQPLGGVNELRFIWRVLLASRLEVSAHLLGEHLAKLYTPLVKGVDTPHEALHCRAMLIERQELSESRRSAFWQQKRERRPVTWEGLVSNELLRHAFCLQFLRCLAQSQCIWLCKEVRHQLVVVGDGLPCKLYRILRDLKADELRRNDSSLVHELVEGMLTIRARFAEVNGSRTNGYLRAIHLHTLAVALHIQLLDVSNKADKRLAVGQNCTAFVSEAAGVPYGQQAHQHREVLTRRGRQKVLIHHLCAIQKLPNNVRAILQ
mmetsp:Transcript_30077/g.65606  ORF Transcript_30077/g.65606 Transcript_30077/m.65606 type:complete len:281 (-) Transcript_30077:904-1746(-)